MIKFFRHFRLNQLRENRFGRYLVYAAGEIILVVIGILIALEINNANQDRIIKRSDQQLLEALITDLRLKNEEVLSDLDYGHTMIQRTDHIIEHWSAYHQLDTADLAYSIAKMGEDFWFYNEKSPVLEGLTNSDLWKRLPDSLIRQIDDVYRVDLNYVKTAFEKATEYSTHCKLYFLIPNGLTNAKLTNEQVHHIISGKAPEYIAYLETFRGGVLRLDNRFELASEAILSLIEDLKEFQSEQKQ